MKGFFKSSIGKKLIMSVTGCFLILFLTFHMCMNLVYVFSAEGYNMVCEFLGSNWYAVAGTLVLALGFVFHIVYASILTIQNRRARGNAAMTIRPCPRAWNGRPKTCTSSEQSCSSVWCYISSVLV